MALTKITKIGSNGLDDDVSAGGGGLGSTDHIDKLLFIHHGGFTADTTIGSPQKFSEIFSHVDATVDIDNGVGVPEDKLKEIFYPMVTTKNDGMGLGLTIAQSIIIQNNGVIECKSKNKETTFSIILPWSSK